MTDVLPFTSEFSASECLVTFTNLQTLPSAVLIISGLLSVVSYGVFTSDAGVSITDLSTLTPVSVVPDNGRPALST